MWQIFLHMDKQIYICISIYEMFHQLVLYYVHACIHRPLLLTGAIVIISLWWSSGQAHSYYANCQAHLRLPQQINSTKLTTDWSEMWDGDRITTRFGELSLNHSRTWGRMRGDFDHKEIPPHILHAAVVYVCRGQGQCRTSVPWCRLALLVFGKHMLILIMQ